MTFEQDLTFMEFIMTRYIGACMAFRREILAKVFPFPSNSKVCAQ